MKLQKSPTSNSTNQTVQAQLAYEVYESFLANYSKRLNEIIKEHGWNDDASYYSKQIADYSAKLEALDALLLNFSSYK